MDMSVVEAEEKPVNVNEVPEYAAEIHTYLREMEVRSTCFLLSLVIFGLWLNICFPVGENQTQGRLHEEAARHNQQHEGHPGGLAS